MIMILQDSTKFPRKNELIFKNFLPVFVFFVVV